MKKKVKNEVKLMSAKKARNANWFFYAEANKHKKVQFARIWTAYKLQ